MTTPIGPYTPVVRAGPWLVTSGQLGLEPGDGPPALVDGGTAAELGQALANAGRLLEEGGAALGHVVKTTVYLTDMGEYAEVNAVYAAFFGEHRPARSVVAVAGLPMGARVEVELWAYLPDR